MLNREVVFPVIVIVLCAVVLALIPQFEVPLYQQDASVGAKFFPSVIILAQLVICIALIVQHLMKKHRSQLDESETTPIVSLMSLMGLLFLIGYAILISFVGYLPASLLSFTAYLACLRVTKPLYYLIAWLFVFGIYFLFAKVFFISLPTGIFY
ncbi:tripartite tricarboxylate transporter TctB family protein [Reinekea thalattae]|uniref:Tripartite tricarboxylate transporter TctB family protein n=1 Tax=Reinekea thalattae TaxID=2593301 RepID=A0A5C8Z5V4_9GAMM|nr:tripartite tricarboxylate transporter TctB family protein [Reinekea thalattae]TXR53495.1 tripartite tricarboxylate transporter TctB family protein [Reinekea thalattae]